METRKKMVSWLHEHEAGVIPSLYYVLDNRALKLYVLEHLAKLDDENVSRKLFEIARGDADPKLREAASRSLLAHTNAVARAYRQR